MCGKLSVRGHYRPAVGKLTDIGGSDVDHRFDCDDHAAADPRTVSGASVIRNARILVKIVTHAVTDVLLDRRIAESGNVAVDRRSDVAYARTLCGGGSFAASSEILPTGNVLAESP